MEVINLIYGMGWRYSVKDGLW
jgi:hypothetical protein